MNWEVLNSLAELCSAKGIKHAVICPGSRNAPLTIPFTANKKITCWTFSDERSAAFIALGMSRQTAAPVALICTSGSAGYNFAPAIAEAFFQQIPLVVFTADRPPEWIDQLDGQTIRQANLYGNHVKQFYELPVDPVHPDAIWHVNRTINEAINLACATHRGPVHINAPFREPLYPATNSPLPDKEPRVIERVQSEPSLDSVQWNHLVKKVSSFRRILVVAGQQETNERLENGLSAFKSKTHWPVAGDILSNLHGLPDFIGHTDAFLGQLPEIEKESLRPDLLITFGKSLIAKNLKVFLRKYSPVEHWHLQPAGDAADTFKTLTKVIAINPATFFQELSDIDMSNVPSWKEYAAGWTSLERKADAAIRSFFTKRDGEFAWVKRVLESLPPGSNLHLANSMSVRYANHIGLTAAQAGIHVFANRGTSGIDGCSSTAVGHCLTSDAPNVLITGDLAFFYDRNAYWHNYKVPNLRVVMLNNHGGIIFNLIDGPAGRPESAKYFVTDQRLTARSAAQEFGFGYHDSAGVDLKTFFARSEKTQILEIESTQDLSKRVFDEFKKQLKKTYEA